MMATIWIKLCRDPKSGRNFRAVYLGRQFVASYWGLPAALDCAKRLAAVSRAEIHSAEIVPFRQGVA